MQASLKRRRPATSRMRMRIVLAYFIRKIHSKFVMHLSELWLKEVIIIISLLQSMERGGWRRATRYRTQLQEIMFMHFLAIKTMHTLSVTPQTLSI